MSEMMGCSIIARMLSNRGSQSVRETADKSPYLCNLFGEKMEANMFDLTDSIMFLLSLRCHILSSSNTNGHQYATFPDVSV